MKAKHRIDVCACARPNVSTRDRDGATCARCAGEILTPRARRIRRNVEEARAA